MAAAIWTISHPNKSIPNIQFAPAITYFNCS